MSATPARYQRLWRSLPWDYLWEHHQDLWIAANSVEDNMWLFEQMAKMPGEPDPMERPEYRLGLIWLHELVEQWT